MTGTTNGNPFDHILLLPAGVKQDELKRWVSTELSEEDDRSGAPGGRLRVLATAILAEQNPGAKIITGGGYGFDVADAAAERPMLADILLQELTDAGVPRARIELERTSNTTLHSLQHLAEKSASTRLGRVAIVTNAYHVPRVEAILKTRFKALASRVDLHCVSAEEVLLSKEPAQWRPLVEGAYASAYMKARMALEKKGEEQIYAGTYKFK